MLPETCDALEAVGITTPFAIQALTLPIALDGHDLIGQARTGTGKTLAFGVPILQRLEIPAERPSAGEGDNRPQALVVVPTRELCLQVTGDLTTAGRTRGVRVLAIYGGRAYEPQIDALRSGVEIVVGTPGRLLDLARQRHLDLSGVRFLVLDEADEMLDLGFLPDVEAIVALTPSNRQTMLFSATMPGPIVALSRRYLNRPTHVRAEQPDETAMVPTTQQHVFRAHAMDKIEMLARVLQAEGRGLSMVFTRTKRTADKVAAELTERGFAAAAVHGDLGQGAREQALRAFRSGKVAVLVATDVAARGIDVEGVTHVVNYQCPEDEKVYVHRIGRTGRAGRSGVAVTFVDWDEIPRWKLINAALELPFPDPPETYSTSEHLYAALDIPHGATGVLPPEQRTRAGLAAERLEDVGETGRSRGRAPQAKRVPHGRPDRPAEDRPARKSRQRRRTRGGSPVDGATPVPGEASTGTGTGAASAATATSTEAQAGAEQRGGDSDGRPPRRRRRGGRGRGRGSGGPGGGPGGEVAAGDA